MSKAASTADYASDEIVFIPRKQIYPDPGQPRVDADGELRASIESQGIIQAITVRPHPALPGDAWMIVDGERRWRGADHTPEIPCRIRLDLEDDADRLVTQISANTGKPLSPIEQARAFRKILDADPKLTQVELAKRLGLPRSTIGDRIRLLEIHPAWVKLIEEGKLQLSHAPAMHRMRAVPEKYQPPVVERLLSKGTGYGLGQDIAKGEPIRIDTFESKLNDCYRPFLRPLADVHGYQGPTVEVKDSWHGPRKYAADPDLWKPIRNAQIKRAREKRQKDGGDESGRESHREQKTTQQMDIDLLAMQGVPVKETKKYRAEPEKGEVEIFARNGWTRAIDPAALLEAIDPSSLAIRKSTDRYSGSGIVVTTDTAAVEKARTAYLAALKESARTVCAKVLAKLTADVLEQHAVDGPGVVHLTRTISPEGSTSALALAIGRGLTMAVDIDGDMLFSVVTRDDAEKLLSSMAAVAGLGLDLPDTYSITNPVSNKRSKVRFVLPEPKSKKQEKREARARGGQVGDPSRAPAINRVERFEEELVGA